MSMGLNTEKHYKALEYDKILKRLSERCSCEDSRSLALSLKPQKTLAEALALLNQTEDAYILLAKFGGPSFGTLKNIGNPLARAAAGSTLSLRELLDIAEDLRVIRSLSEWRARNNNISKPNNKTSAADGAGSPKSYILNPISSLDVFFGALTPNKFLEDKITSAVLSEDEVADSASPELYDIRRAIRRQSAKAREHLENMTRSAHYRAYLQDAIVTQRNGRFVIPVKNEHRGEVAGLVHDTSSSGQTVFVEPMAVVEANNEIKVLQSREADEIERIISELSAMAGSFKDSIIAGYENAVELNLIFAKGHLAYDMKASVPLLNDGGIIDFKKARHPLLDPKAVVPTDINLGGDFDTLVITGPNTGGKTVSIKTAGLLTLMAASGFMIPAADNSRAAVFDRVFADIGDEQSIEQSLSTFSSHITNIINIIENCGGSTLALIDELGAGTDPVEGAALAMAILERLCICGCKTAATTHYAELKAYALRTPRVQNASCEFDVNTLRPTYRLLVGVPGRSNAFAISERLGMEKALVDRAREFVASENARFEDVVDSLEKSRLEMEKEKEIAEDLRAKAEKAKDETEKRRSEIEKAAEKELEKAKGEAKRLTENAKREAAALLNEIELLRKEKNNTDNIATLAGRAKAEMKRRVTAVEDAADPVFGKISAAEEDCALPRMPVPGETVLLADIGREAVVLSPPDKNNVEVQAGIIKMRAPLANIRLIGNKKDANPANPLPGFIKTSGSRAKTE
ncbi:MAG: endonuclease MutS2, partial [Oscillospiraceae bacterium]|nr:endonuclease MutS2 [Oscillospiraceae bacterium]